MKTMKTRNETRTPAQEYARKIRIEKAKLLGLTVGGIVVFTLLLVLFTESLAEGIRGGQAEQEDTPTDGIGRVYTEEVPRYAAGETAKTGTCLRVWCETDPDLPEWWDPEGAEIVYQDPNARTTHSDALDYNINTTLWGWDGHGAEEWELDLFSRVFYLEFWGASQECCEAGCDAILNLWATGLYGRTLFESLSYYDPKYGYTYRVYPRVWETDYDADGLAWCRALCEERFINGPEWCAQYFQLGGYHDPNWVTPAYQLDGVYFSVAGAK